MNSEKLIKLAGKYPFSILAAIVTVVLIAGIVFRNGTVSALDEESVQLTDKLDKMHRNARNSITLDDHSARLDEYLARIDGALADPESKSSNLAYLYELGSRCGVSVTRAEQSDLSVQKPAKGKVPEFLKYATFTFSISIEGEFANTLKFINNLKHERFIARFENIRYSPADILAGRKEKVEITVTVLAARPEEEPEKK